MNIIEPSNRDTLTINTLTTLWRRSVEASHFFLSAKEIDDIETIIPNALQEIAHLSLVVDDHGTIHGFIGIDSKKIEMLFVDPQSFGKGIGSLLVKYALEEHKAYKVDVNKDNPNALWFYISMGFEIESESDQDEQGNPYPILHLTLPQRKEV